MIWRVVLLENPSGVRKVPDKTGQRLSSKSEIYLSVFMLPSTATKVPTP
jgi:hypothetical protein